MKEIKFLTFADFHYKKKMYPAKISDIEAILERGRRENVNLCVHLGDLCNDYKGSPELIKALLDNAYGMTIFGVYGNHELESAENSMDYVTPRLSNSIEEAVFGTSSGKIEDGSIGYYYYDNDCFRFIFLDTNYSLSPTGEYEHNRTASWGKPKENTMPDSLGEEQLSWLREVLLSAAKENKKCIIFAHASFCGAWKSSPDADRVRAIFREANETNSKTVCLSVNGHYHTNHTAMVDDVCYFDCHAAINGWWQSEKFYPYSEHDENSPKYTFHFTGYDENGNPLESVKMPYSAIRMGAQSLFFESPLSAVVTVYENGEVKISGSSTSWAYGIAPDTENEAYLPMIRDFDTMLSLAKNMR